jgi:hypothetical protein
LSSAIAISLRLSFNFLTIRSFLCNAVAWTAGLFTSIIYKIGFALLEQP